MTNQPTRRKPYNKDITARNKAKERERAQRRDEGKVSWDELTEFHGACCQLFSAIPDLATALRAPLVSQHATAEQKAELMRRGSSLARDVREYRASLDAIAQKHSGKTGVVNDDVDGLEVMTIGLEYNEWQESFQRVVIPTANDITEIIATIVETVEKQNAQSSEDVKENDAT